MFRTIMEQLETDPMPLGTSHIPSHIPPRRCGGLCFKRPCASRRDTPHERDTFQEEENDVRPPCTVRARRPADVPHHFGAFFFFSRRLRVGERWRV